MRSLNMDKKNEDLAILDKALELGIPSMSPGQFEQWENLIAYLKERISHRVEE
jgi:hypothetical protein